MPAVIANDQMELPIAVLMKGRASPRRYQRVRADSLPEKTRYRDEGCEVHPSCLSCPLPRCRYDEPGGLRALVNGLRDRRIIEMRLNGVPVETLADRFCLSRRTIFRILGSNGHQASEARCA